jgi:predicted nucleic acid-binding protein
MRALIDTNVILDALLSRTPHNADAEKIILAIASEQFAGFITANSVTDIIYVLRKSLQQDLLLATMHDLLELLPILNVRALDCWEALDLDEGDYEDALQLQCALANKLDCIVSRDAAFLRRTAENMEIISPGEFLRRLMCHA